MKRLRVDTTGIMMRTVCLGGVFALALAAPLALDHAWGKGSKRSGYSNDHLLVETQGVAGHLGDPNLLLVDLRGRGGYAAYARGHIPGAVYLNWQDLDDLASNRKGFPIDQAKAETLFSDVGIDRDIRVIAYDDSGGLWAARLFFVLEFFGHQRVAVLDGGLMKWVREGRPLTTEEPKITAKHFVARPNPKLIATAAWVRDNLKNPRICLVDARSPHEYHRGRVPGAVLINWVDTINQEDWTFRSAEELQKMFEAAGAKKGREIVTYCQSGFRAAHDYFVARLLGYEKVRNYDGSWVDWGNRPELPVER